MPMKFLTRNEEYIVQYSKKEALEMLRSDKRLNKVVNGINKITIYTNIIKPKGKKFKHPIGSYKIEIGGMSRFEIKIKRIEGIINDMEHIHINHSWSHKICWGTLENEIPTLMRNRDWYWISKRVLDLVYDWAYDTGMGMYDYNDLIKDFQVDYCKKHKIKW